MCVDEAKTEQSRMWYGMIATVAIGPGFIHKAGFGKISLPHPPVINWLIRQDLTEDARGTLSITHEFGHLQTLPLALLYTLAMPMLAYFKSHAGLIDIIIVLISTHAAWEIMAEIYTIANDIRFYRKSYEEITVVPRLIFWLVVGILGITGWITIFF